jgi:SAM-dependent methyltransferase
VRSHLDRCGLVSSDAFAEAGYGVAFAELERAQVAFLSRESVFRSLEYRWVSDALHEWSRCWEYVYARHHVRALGGGAPRCVLDFGSGVTFFPFVLARDGWDVVCVDNDPVVTRDLTAAAAVEPSGPGSVRALLAAGALPLADASLDAAYSISVLEHIPNPLLAVAELARVVRPGGAFVLTVDIDLTGRGALAPEPFAALLDTCERYFERAVPETTVHPLRVLDCFGGPFPRRRAEQVPGLMMRGKSGALRPLIGGPVADEPVRLACYAAAFTRR